MEAEKIKEIASSLIKGARGNIEVVVIASEDGLPLATEVLGKPVDTDAVAAVGAAISGATGSLIAMFESEGGKEVVQPRMIDTVLPDGRHLIVKPVGNVLICTLTSTSPNLGLIFLLLESIDQIKE